MKKAVFAAVIFSLLAISNCAPASPPPLGVGDRLVVPDDHAFVIPPGGIRFSNGATIGVQPQ